MYIPCFDDSETGYKSRSCENRFKSCFRCRHHAVCNLRTQQQQRMSSRQWYHLLLCRPIFPLYRHLFQETTRLSSLCNSFLPQRYFFSKRSPTKPHFLTRSPTFWVLNFVDKLMKYSIVFAEVLVSVAPARFEFAKYANEAWQAHKWRNFFFPRKATKRLRLLKHGRSSWVPPVQRSRCSLCERLIESTAHFMKIVNLRHQYGDVVVCGKNFVTLLSQVQTNSRFQVFLFVSGSQEKYLLFLNGQSALELGGATYEIALPETRRLLSPWCSINACVDFKLFSCCKHEAR